MFMLNFFRSKRSRNDGEDDYMLQDDQIDELIDAIDAGPEDLGLEDKQWKMGSFFYLLEKRFGVKPGQNESWDDENLH